MALFISTCIFTKCGCHFKIKNKSFEIFLLKGVFASKQVRLSETEKDKKNLASLKVKLKLQNTNDLSPLIRST
jgi:hypothetical protein